MLVNSPSNDSLLHSHVLNVSSSSLLNMDCYFSNPASFIMIITSLTTIVSFLPIITFIIYHGVKQWRQNNSSVTMSNCDLFTYHMVVMDLIGLVGYTLRLFILLTLKEDSKIIVSIIKYMSFFYWHGLTFFHILTCLERYLAVIHPITYLSLKTERGIRIRNVTIGCVWLLCLAGMGLEKVVILDICFYMLSVMIVSFCSLSVLCVLIHPGPGEKDGHREKVDQFKQRAFYTIVVILGVLVLRGTGSLVWTIVLILEVPNGCLIMACVSCSAIPSSLVLPLLFLHRARRLVCCKNNHTSPIYR